MTRNFSRNSLCNVVILIIIGMEITAAVSAAQMSTAGFSRDQHVRVSPRDPGASNRVLEPRFENADDPMFLPPFAYLLGNERWSWAVVSADVNGDGKADLLVSADHVVHDGCTGTELAVMLGNGDGTFQPAVFYDPGGTGACVAKLAVADLNGDGKPDVVVANDTSNVGVLIGRGDGSFKPVVTYNAGTDVLAVAVADVSRDGKPDIVAGNYNGAVGVLLGNGDGTFQPATAYASGSDLTFSIALGDVNGDGNPDVEVAHCRDGAVGVLLGKGDGSFPSLVNITGAESCWGVAVGVNLDSLFTMAFLRINPGWAPILQPRILSEETAEAFPSTPGIREHPFA